MPILSVPSHPVYFNLSCLRLNLAHQLQRSQTVAPEASCECHGSKSVTAAYPDWGEGELAQDSLSCLFGFNLLNFSQ